jgi:site-specific DNA-adenine methylase
MTYYPGGKKKLGKELSRIIYDISMTISKNDNFDLKGYCEPFCGMLGVYQYVPDLFNFYNFKFEAGDRNPYIIKLWKGLQNGFNPPTACSKEEYYKLKKNHDSSLRGIFLGFACSIRGVFRSTFIKRNIEVQAQHCKKIGKKIKNVNFRTGNYDIYTKLKGYVIYCDPPYKNTGTPYSIGDVYDTKFDYNKFIDWCYKMSENNIIFISEYTKPCKDAILVWNDGKEKLYLLYL